MKLIASISISSSGVNFLELFPPSTIIPPCSPSRSFCCIFSLSCCAKTAGFQFAELNISGEGSETALILLFPKILLLLLEVESIDSGKLVLPAGLIWRHSSSRKGSNVVYTRVFFSRQAMEDGDVRLKMSSGPLKSMSKF